MNSGEEIDPTSATIILLDADALSIIKVRNNFGKLDPQSDEDISLGFLPLFMSTELMIKEHYVL